MRPAFSIILFTTVAGAAQGLVVALAVACLLGFAPGAALPAMLWCATAMLVVALTASFFHLGHPLRAWRAARMWRTSWMSREVIVLPVFIAVVAGWAVVAGARPTPAWLCGLAIVCALLLWHCTAMIYACIRFIREWAHPLTVVNYLLLGLASGAVTAGTLAALSGETVFADAVAPWAVALTVLAWIGRAMALRRNARLKPVSTTQTATGIAAARVVQTSMGMTGGSFNTKEFRHGVSRRALRSIRVAFQVLAFALPSLVLLQAAASGSPVAWVFALACQSIGLIGERWFFFAQAQHPQNLYYQLVC